VRRQVCAVRRSATSRPSGHLLPCIGATLSSSADLKVLASARVREAKALLEAREWSGAYYLVGYAVECGLKARITKTYKKYQLVDPRVGRGIYTHDLIQLVGFANLASQLKADMDADAVFAIQWGIVKDWNESSRYSVWTESDARELYEAVKKPMHGVLRWLKQYW
jgi:hypothetical protein